MPKEKIGLAIKEVLDEEFGFEIYIIMKDKNVKRFLLDEGNPLKPSGFKSKIRDSIKEEILNTFLADDSKYANGDDLSNEQNCFYVIAQSNDYQPFGYLNTEQNSYENFKEDDKNNADAILFEFSYQRDGDLKRFWAYQKILPVSLPNKEYKFFQLIAKSKNQQDVFMEMKKQMFVITRKIDLLILNNEIITSNIKLMERHFNLETFINALAKEAATSIANIGLVENSDKLYKYIERHNKKYAKKMMQIHKFPVVYMKKSDLLEKLQFIERWKDVFQIQNNLIYLRNFSDVENMIDLFTERYTVSQITKQEYDTSIKDKAKPIVKSNATNTILNNKPKD